MQSKNNLLNYLACFLIGILSGGTSSYFVSMHILENLDIEEIKQVSLNEDSAIIDSISNVSKSVVSIITSKEVSNFRSNSDIFNMLEEFGFFGSRRNLKGFENDSNSLRNKEEDVQTQKIGGGSGFVITEDGIVLTNKHVVSVEDGIYEVFLSDGSNYYADILSVDPLNDLAVLQIFLDEEKTKKPKNLPISKLGNSDALEIGSRVIAIGNALSEFKNTTTLGIISGKNREILASDGFSSSKLSNLLQTDASINPGNSGGPLVNLAGEVVGINTAMADGNGIGFAIPINEAKTVVDSVKKYGKILRPILGVRYNELNPMIAKKLNLDVEYGAYLLDDIQNGIPAIVEDSPAFKAGLKSGDIITGLDGEKINEENTLSDLIKNKSLDDTVSIEVFRDGKYLNLNTKLEVLDLEKL